MDEILGIVKEGRFEIIPDDRAKARLTRIQVQQAVTPESEEVPLATHEGKILKVEGVMQGDWIASSGNAGATGGVPHLHFQVSSCKQRSVCGTLPVTFRNTDPNPEGLVLGRNYPARP